MLKAIFKAKNIYEILSPVFFASGMFGLSSFGLSKRGCNLGRWKLVWPLLFFSVAGITSFYALFTRNNAESVSMIIKLVNTLEVYVSIINTLILILLGAVFRNKVAKIIDKLSYIDHQMERSFVNINTKQKHENEKYLTSCATLLFLVLPAILSVVNIMCLCPKHMEVIDFGKSLAYCLPLVAPSLVTLQFSLILILIRERFSWINKEMELLKDRWNKRCKLYECAIIISSAEYAKKKLTISLDNFWKMYVYLQDLTQELNQVYSLQLFLIILQNFLTITVQFSYLVKKSISTDEKNETEWCHWFAKGQLCLSFLEIISLVCSSCSTFGEAQRTEGILHDIKITFEKLEQQVTYFSIQIMQIQNKIKILNTFFLDEELLSSIIGSIITYLVLLLQMEI